MRVVVALGGSALRRLGQPMSAEQQRQNVQSAAQSLAPVAAAHQLVISHGDGLLWLQGTACQEGDGYPLDVGAQTDDMMGSLIEQELRNLLPFEQPIASIMTMAEVDPDDPAFHSPDRFIGPAYPRDEAERLATERGWAIRPEGEHWRRVVPSPAPRRILQVRPVQWLLERGCVVICSGGGGIPTTYRRGTSMLERAEVVVDGDRASALLAREIKADLLVMTTDEDAVYEDWGTPQQRAIGCITAAELSDRFFGADSMGPKVEAAIDFVTRTGKRAAIGLLDDVQDMVAGTAGTNVIA